VYSHLVGSKKMIESSPCHFGRCPLNQPHVSDPVSEATSCHFGRCPLDHMTSEVNSEVY
jgi:hypothetical protein